MKTFLVEFCVTTAQTLVRTGLVATWIASCTTVQAEAQHRAREPMSRPSTDRLIPVGDGAPRLLGPLDAQPLTGEWLPGRPSPNIFDVDEDWSQPPIIRTSLESLDQKASSHHQVSKGGARSQPQETVEEVFADVWPEVARALGESPLATGTLVTSTPAAKTTVGDVSPKPVGPAKGAPSSLSAPSKVATATPTVAQRPIPPSVMALREPLAQCLQLHVQNRLNTADDGCWSIMHGFLGWGPNTEIHVGGPRGKRVNAIRWITQNQPCAGQPLFYLVGDQIRGREGAGFQGHPGQFLAMLAQTGVDASQPMQVENRAFTVADLIRAEQATCAQNTELTFKLIGLSYYLPTKASWKNEQGETWDFSRIVQLEIAQPINGAACGGTHRLMGLTFSLAQRKRQQVPIDGHWARAEKYIQDYQRYTLTLQNRDGSFSSDWFKRRAEWGDLDRRVQTTGHMMEWMIYSLPDEGLYHPQVVQGVNFLVNSLIQHRFHDWQVGPKHHAIRALRLYQERVFLKDTAVARQPANAAK